jgi:hypothetical protein
VFVRILTPEICQAHMPLPSHHEEQRNSSSSLTLTTAPMRLVFVFRDSILELGGHQKPTVLEDRFEGGRMA